MTDPIYYTFEQLFEFENQLSDELAYLVVAKHMPNNSYKTYKISLDSIAAQLNNSLDLNSAAHMMSSNFALSGHDHDIFTSASYEAVELDDDSIPLKVMSISAFNSIELTNEWSLCIATSQHAGSASDDLYAAVSAYMPKLGTVQFISMPDIAKISRSVNITNPSFIGWVKADGSEY